MRIDQFTQSARFADSQVATIEPEGLVRSVADARGPFFFVPPTSGLAANGKPVFSWDQAAAQLTRDGVFWGAAQGMPASAMGQPVTITYAYRSNAPSTMPTDTSGFERFNTQQIIATEKALQYWADVANITFQRAGFGTTGDLAYSNFATILFANYTSGAAAASAFAYYPGNAAFWSVSGDVWVNSSIGSNATPVYFDIGPRTILHEIGHALGLAHPSEYDAAEGVTFTYGADASYWQDSNMFTVMSYFGSFNTGASLGGFANAPQLHDIAAIQRLYGANMNTRAGDTVYGFNSTSARENSTILSASQAIVFAIWDGGGFDTLDLSGYSQNADIDLREESFSSAGPNTSGGGALYNISIARGAIIERGIGGSGNDTMTGNAVNNILIGGAGNDRLDGGVGADSLIGGVGDDVYVVDNVGDIVTEAMGQGLDSLVSSVSIALAPNVEYLFLVGPEAFAGTGNGLDNRIFGTALANRIDGGGGADLLIGGGGDDLYIVDSAFDAVLENLGEGIDTVFATISYTLAANVEFLVLFGSSAFAGTGNGLDNRIFGTVEANRLDGGGGGDLLIGGGGDDLYLVDAWDSILENAGEGVDTALAFGASFTLGAHVENLVVGGGGAFSGVGNDLGNRLIGGVGADTLFGLGGDDVFVLDAGDDTAYGGDGDDFVVGGGGGDWLFGGQGNDVLLGNEGADLFEGGAGRDTMYLGVGGAGDNDLLVVRADAGLQIVHEFEAGGGNDRVLLAGTGLTSFAAVQAALRFNPADNTTVLQIDGDTALVFIGLTPQQFTADDFLLG